MSRPPEITEDPLMAKYFDSYLLYGYEGRPEYLDTQKSPQSGVGRRAFLFSGLGALAAGGLALGGYGLMQPEPEAPVPEVQFQDSDPDTYVAVEGEAGGVIPRKYTGAGFTIPSLGMEVEMVKTGKQGDGFLDLPEAPKATWYDATAEFGSPEGRSLIAGHVDLREGKTSPFNDLYKIEKGAPIQVFGFDGKTYDYVASSIAVYERQSLPKELFTLDGPEQLVLVTCSGPVIKSPAGAHYTYNLVVIANAVKVEEVPAEGN